MEQAGAQGRLSKRMKDLLSKRGKDNKELDDMRNDLLEVREAVNKWANTYVNEKFPGENGRPYLPDKPYVEIDSLRGLITDKSQRAELLFAQRQPGDVVPTSTQDRQAWADHFFYNSDTVGVPQDWIEMGDSSYVVLMIPKYRDVYKSASDVANLQPEDAHVGNTGYDIAVVARKGDKIYRLLSNNEQIYKKNRQRYENGGLVSDPLPLPPLLDADFQLHDIEVTDVNTFPVRDSKALIWMGDLLRGGNASPYDPANVDRHREMTINGSISYLFQKGSPSVAKQDQGIGAPSQIPNLGGSIPSPIPVPGS